MSHFKTTIRMGTGGIRLWKDGGRENWETHLEWGAFWGHGRNLVQWKLVRISKGDSS